MEPSVSERIKILYAHFGSGNLSAFARFIGVNAQTVRDLMRGEKGGPSWPVLQNILHVFPSVEMPWLLLGQGEMLKKDAPPVISAPAQNISSYEPGSSVHRDLQPGDAVSVGGIRFPTYSIPVAPRKPQPPPPPLYTEALLGLDLLRQVASNTQAIAALTQAVQLLQQDQAHPPRK